MIINAKIVGKSANPEEYHLQDVERGNPKFPVSSSVLREFSVCPSRWLAGYQSPESEAKEFGSLLDCLLLTPEQFPKRYAVQPGEYTNEKGETKDWNNNANVCRKWREQQGGKLIIRADSKTDAQYAVSRLLEDEIIKGFVFDSDRQVWVSAQWQDKGTGLVVPLKCLIDLVPRNETEFAKCLADLKTTRNAALMPWQRWCFQAGYYIQAAFNRAMYCAAMPKEDRNTFCFLLVENYAPWQPAKRMLSQDFTDLGTAEFTRLLGNYCQCLKSNRWPNYDETDEAIQGSWSLVSPEPWMADHAAFAPKFNFDEQAESAPDANDIVP